MPRALCVAVTLCALALAAPAQAAKPTLSIKAPAAGDLTLAHVVVSTKGGKGTPKLVLTNRSKLSARLTIAGGVKKLKKNSYLASIAVLHRTGGASPGTPAFKLALPKGMTFSKFTSKIVAKNLLAGGAKPKFCGAVPTGFSYVSKKLLAGSFLPGFSAAYEYVNAGYAIGCGSYDDRATLAAALRGESDPGSGGGTGDQDEVPGDDGGDYDEGDGIPKSPTLHGSATVFDEGGGVFRYEITFNEPVYEFAIDAQAPVRCPTQYGEWKTSECDPLGTQSASAGGQSLACFPGEFSYQFGCGTPQNRSNPSSRATVAAGTKIEGRYKLDPGATGSGTVRVSGIGPSGKSQAEPVSGP
ncbi:MAG TPA: hypothetical protein VF715_01710 [Thermoleophilaceae bacterium]